MKKPESSFKNIFMMFKPFFREYLITLFCMTLGAIVSLQYPLVLKIIVDDVLINKNQNMLFLMVIVYILLFLLGFFFNFLTAFMNELNVQSFAFNLKKRLFSHLQNTPMSFFNNTSMGELISNFNADIDAISNFISQELSRFFTNVLNVIVVIVMLSILRWQLAILLIILIPFFFLSNILTRDHFKKFFQENRELVTTGNNLYQNVFYNIKLVKLFVAQRIFLKQFLQWQNKAITVTMRRVVAGNLLQQLTMVIFLVGNVIIIWYGAIMVFQNQLTIGGLVAFYTYVPSLFLPIGALVNSSVQLRNFETSVNRLSKYLDMKTEKTVKSKYKITRGDINYQNVSFKYGDRLILQDVSIAVKNGEKVAFIGKNGSGKTTLVNLLLRLYDIQSGNIYIDGIDITKYPLNYLRKRIGIVTQEVNFFNLSIEDNFRISNPYCRLNDIIKACQVTGAHEFISQLPDGYKTVIGERGYNFSGGQLQKMAISRLILKNPDLIIFDEATSSLDQESTEVFYQLFESTFKERTILFILHDLKNIVFADKVVLLKDGTVKNIYLKKDFSGNQDIYEELQKCVSEAYT
jgi:ABC-type bacteriocin/lantibiotic exporter with double-glycine peptidase domain